MITLKQINEGRARHGMPPIVLPNGPEEQKRIKVEKKEVKQRQTKTKRIRAPAPKTFWLMDFLHGLLWLISVTVLGVLSAIVTLMVGKVHKR